MYFSQIINLYLEKLGLYVTRYIFYLNRWEHFPPIYIKSVSDVPTYLYIIYILIHY